MRWSLYVNKEDVVVDTSGMCCKFASLVGVISRELFGVYDCRLKIFGARVGGIWAWGGVNID